MDLQQISDSAMALIMDYGLKLLGAIAVWIIGSWVIKAMVKATQRLLDKRNIDDTLKPFLKSMVSILLKVMLVISVLSMLGVEMTSFIAFIGAAGLAIGMALSGNLQNFAGGVMILIFKPFKVGDVLEAQGFIGSVSAIQIFNTIMKTPDNKTIILPNGPLSSGPMTNFSTEPRRRVDWTFGIGYGDSAEKAKKVLMELIEKDSRILKDPAPFIALSELADSSVNFVVRAWVNAADYWGVFFDMNQSVYQAFDKEGLNIPYPQMDVHVHQTGQLNGSTPKKETVA